MLLMTLVRLSRLMRLMPVVECAAADVNRSSLSRFIWMWRNLACVAVVLPVAVQHHSQSVLLGAVVYMVDWCWLLFDPCADGILVHFTLILDFSRFKFGLQMLGSVQN